MSLAALLVALVALALAVRALMQPRGAPAADPTAALARRAAAAAEEVEGRLERLQALLARLAAGQPVDPAMIEEGRLWAEVDADAARRMVEEAPPGLVLLDVRTRPEVESGHVPGIRWIPVDAIEQRYREVPRDGRVLVFCAAGARSAAACEFLTGHGYRDVVNVAGGMSAWRGAVERGLPAH